MTQFITHLLQITHYQGVYCNKIAHDKNTGKERSKELQTLQMQIGMELERGLYDLLAKDHCLREILVNKNSQESWTWQQYGLLAVKTAQIEASLASQPHTGVG